ncbi:MAG: ATP-binding protein, partial [Halioglobus sp.]|nr:ATP-binding protein [Halioglobus sp.]
SLTQILLFIIAYLSGLFAVAYLADRGTISRRITHHPAVYVLSLGVFAGVMATNGAMALAVEHGYSFLLYYLGVVLMFVAAAMLLMPLLRLCRVYQLASLADVLAFRFRSPLVGGGVAVAMCLTLMPLLALQIHAVAESIHLLAGDDAVVAPGPDRHNRLAMLFCIIIAAFSMLFGTRHRLALERNIGLVTAMAFESLVKLTAMLVLMGAAVFQVFGGFGELQQWLAQNPGVGTGLRESVDGEIARTLLLVFMAGAVCMPHIFHMTFAENSDSRELRSATWGLPLYLLVLALPVLPVLWAGIKLGQPLPADYSGLALGMTLQSVPLSGAAFVASLSAASATIIVSTLALANMCLNHLVVPLRLPRADRAQSLYSQLRWQRRILITLLILGGYAFHATLEETQQLAQLALLALAGTLQFLPGIIATPNWPRANRLGLLVGLGAGLLLWALALLLPLAGGYEPTVLNRLFAMTIGLPRDPWSAATLASLFLNTTLFVAISLLTSASKAEKVAAEICSMDARARPTRRTLSVTRAAEFSACLAPALGEKAAQSEVDLALKELQFSPQETRPYALRRLRARIEANLSGLLGPAAASRIIESTLPFQPGVDENSADMHLVERDLDRSRSRFTGLAADLDDLRRHHRETLEKLPIGVCAVSAQGEILMWNRSMQSITGVDSNQVIGSLASSIPAPWNSLLVDFRAASEDTAPKSEVTGSDGGSRWIRMHKAAISDGDEGDSILLVEDITDYQLLESELLHNERLASIGRLAAGVAHEIGNPVTGIACLAQNLEYETDASEIRHAAQDILKQTNRVTRIVESLMNFSHTGAVGGDLTLSAANLADCVDEAIHLLSLDREARPVRFSNLCDRELLVLADSQRLLQVFVNLLGNARDACEEYGEVRILARETAQEIRVDVEDNGCGIPADIQDQVFEPFFTTKDPGAGTGLGLALVYSIMEDMRGKVHIDSPIATGPNPGTRVSLQLQRTSYGPTFQV